MIIRILLLNLLPVWMMSQDVGVVHWQLYDGEIPNSKSIVRDVIDHRDHGGRFISRTSIPTMTYYQPSTESRKAVVICPGGGYRGVAIDKEGHDVARILQRSGMHAFVLKYRAPLDSSCLDKSLAPLQDAQYALNKVKDSLAHWGITESIVGIMGFSAGGHLAALTSNIDESFDLQVPGLEVTKPDFSVLIYPVITMTDPHTHMGSRNNLLGHNPETETIERFSTELQVDKHTPRTFLLHASDDQSVPVENSLIYYSACLKANVPVEMHIYQNGGHGSGLKLPSTTEKWIERLLNWLNTF